MSAFSIFRQQSSLADDIATRDPIQKAQQSYNALMEFAPDLTPAMCEDAILKLSQGLSEDRLNELSNQLGRDAHERSRQGADQRFRAAQE